jgi:hypothetical protein
VHVNVYLYIHVIVCIPGHWASSKALCGPSTPWDLIRCGTDEGDPPLLLTCAMVKIMIWSMVIPCHGNPEVIAIEIPIKIRFDDHPRWWKTTHLLTPWFLNPMPQVPSAKSSAFSPFRYLASHGRLHVVPGKLPSVLGYPEMSLVLRKRWTTLGFWGYQVMGTNPTMGINPAKKIISKFKILGPFHQIGKHCNRI